MNAYRIALMPGMEASEAERFQMFQTSNDFLSVQGMIERIGLTELDEPLLRERGYSISDWLKFTWGLIRSFSADEYWRAPPKADLVAFLRSEWDLEETRVHSLLQDYGLSHQSLRDVEIKDMMPVEKARRDSRLIRRPVVSLEDQGVEYCLYGVETVSLGFQMVLARIESRRIEFIKDAHTRELRSVIGALTRQLGFSFQKYIQSRCHELGYETKIEKDKIKEHRIPQGEGFGPVDVFVRRQKRAPFYSCGGQKRSRRRICPRENEERT